MAERIKQLVYLLTAAAAIFLASLLAGPIQQQRQQLGLSAAGLASEMQQPKTVLLQVAPGGLRAPFLTYLWIRSERLKADGKFFDARQIRDLICDMMPHFPAVWVYHSWDMAWNISVATHTQQERWMWVQNGIDLLRDRGLLYNPDDLSIHRQLAWIYTEKIARYTDDMHMIFKRRVAEEMDVAVGAPPSTGLAKDAVDAFGLIAQAPDDLPGLLAEPHAAGFVALLRVQNVGLDENFLTFYNRFCGEPDVGLFMGGKAPPTEREKPIADLMSSPQHAAGRAKVLAFARKSLLRGKYKMDALWMLQLMERYGPLDWRNPNSLGIYWSTQGLHKSGVPLTDMDALNTDRTFLTALKALTATGQLYWWPDLNDPDHYTLDWGPDWRFIEPTSREYYVGGEKLGEGDINSPKNLLRDGHLVYLSNAICQLYVGGREELAQQYLDELNRRYAPPNEVYKLPLFEFARDKINQFGTPMYDMSKAFWSGALVRVYQALLNGNMEDYNKYREFAQRVFKMYMEDIGRSARMKVPAPDWIENLFDLQDANFLCTMLLRPEAVGMHLPLVSKSRLYKMLSIPQQQTIYPVVRKHLPKECQREQVNFDAAFPAPPEAPTPKQAPRAEVRS